MSNMNIFEYAVRNKVRFNYKGSLTVEDLWDLPMQELDGIYKQLKSQAKVLDEDSLMASKSKEDAVIETKIEIVKYIFNEKVAAVEAKNKAKANKEKKERLMAILAERQEEDLRSKSAEELMQMINELD